MTHGSLFSGIGGFDLAAEWMGWENKFHCEINPFGRKILNYYWPNAECYEDITKTDFTIWRGRIDVLSGGFPCQPYSLAGKRKGKEDERHLWPEMLRAIREIRPGWVVGENVFGLINWSGGLVFDEVQTNLEAEGYEVFPYVLPAASINAPHRRDRVWFVAYSNSNGQHRSNCKDEINTSERGKYAQRNIKQMGRDVTNTSKIGFSNTQPFGKLGRKQRFEFNNEQNIWEKFPTQSPICSGNDGIPYKLDAITFSKWRNESIKGYGNAIVPQVVLQIFKTIEKFDQQLSTLRSFL